MFSWLHFRDVKGPAGERANIDRAPIGIERDGTVLIGAEDRRADVAVPLQDWRRGVPEMVRAARAEYRDLRPDRIASISFAVCGLIAASWRQGPCIHLRD